MEKIKTRVIAAQLDKADFLTLSAALYKRGARTTGWWSRLEPFVAAAVGMIGGYAATFALGAQTPLAIAVGAVAALVLTFAAHVRGDEPLAPSPAEEPLAPGRRVPAAVPHVGGPGRRDG
ncbi:MAG: hypothetical protein FD124_3669 [Alphaproteobacteria bacterium]|nr:MAG: hypothetical protein FD124_3669 [Alphaproteobacteria bacterium]